MNDNNDSTHDIKRLCGINILSQNVNTLNTSSNNSNNAKSNHFTQKINAILKTGCDLIFLQDIRASCRIAVIGKIIECTKNGNYKMFYNSSKSKRGVCILYKANLDIEVRNVFKSPCENLILLDCLLNNTPITIGSAYGPTDIDNPIFITEVKSEIVKLGNKSFIIAGDFNCIQNMIPLIRDKSDITSQKKKYYDINSEILNMSSIPNKRNSQLLCDLIADEFFVDPFRHFFPNRREYSYVPFNKRNDNRSRIDFFLTSHDILAITEEINYTPLLTSLFDHKAVKLRLGVKKKETRISIDNKSVFFPGMFETATVSALDLYRSCTDLNLQPVIQELNQVLLDLKSVVLFKTKLIYKDLLVEQFCISLSEKFLNIRHNALNWAELSSQELNVSKEIFFQTLQNNIKNDMFAYQQALKKSERSFVTKTNNELNRLKDNPETTCEQVFSLEQNLSAYYDLKNLIECQKNKQWELFNLEKPNTAFCAMTKGKNKSDTLDLIKDNTIIGNPVSFQNSLERNEHIKNYYSEIYTSKGLSDITIEQFLGPDIVNSNYVRDKQLTDEEKLSMEHQITSDELTESLRHANKGSAAGHDGWSYKLIFFLWDILKEPLASSFNEMIINGRLGDPFRLVNVKLLPKKGDLHNIKNYRPISLLSNFYKLCSGAFNRRLTKFTDRITSNRQKAYSKTKVSHECILNILDNMKKAILSNSKLAIVLCDFSKAFDKIEHDFMTKTLLFFGFGQYMIQILKTILTGRVGGILTKEGLTALFDFLCGSGQGDSASATLFILGIEILLIKLFLDPALKKVIIPNPSYRHGSETLGVNAYADDITEMILGSSENLVYLKNIFSFFSRLSGLELNVDKTTVIPVAASNTQDFKQEIRNIGFDCDESFTVLGFKIDNKLSRLHENVDNIKFKMSNISNFWSKVPMTLCGKITVAKTFLLSQIAYICAVIPTPERDFRIFDKIISNFITYKSGIKEKLVFTKTCHGGLGLTRSRDFIDGIRLGLTKRYLKSSDSWADCLRISQFLPNENFQFDLGHPIFKLNPYTLNIAKSTVPFSAAFFNLEGNLLKAKLFENTCVFRNNEGRSLKLYDIDPGTIRVYKKKLETIRPLDVINPQHLTFLEKPALENKNNVILSANDYEKIKEFVVFNLYKKRAAFNKTCLSLTSFFNKYKKGSKHFRRIIENYKNFEREPNTTRLNSRLHVIDNVTFEPNIKRDMLFSLTFSVNLIENSFRTTFFQFQNSYWKLNNQINKFIPEIPPHCSYCLKKGVINPEKESISHFFNNCQTIDEILKLFWEIIPDDNYFELIAVKKILLLGFDTDSTHFNKLGNIIVLLTLAFIKFQRNKKLVSVSKIYMNFISQKVCTLFTVSSSFRGTVKLSRKFKPVKANCGFFLHQNEY